MLSAKRHSQNRVTCHMIFAQKSDGQLAGDAHEGVGAGGDGRGENMTNEH